MSKIYGGELDAGEAFDGRLPVSLRRLSLDDLADLYALFTRWFAYVTSVQSEILVQRSSAVELEQTTWSMVRMRHAKAAARISQSLTDQRLSDLARYDGRYVSKNAAQRELTALRDCVDALLKVADKNLSLISREITRRDVLLSAEGRGRNVSQPRRGAGQGGFKIRETR